MKLFIIFVIASTVSSSSGPLIYLSNFKLIGIHKGNNKIDKNIKINSLFNIIIFFQKIKEIKYDYKNLSIFILLPLKNMHFR